MKTAKKEIDTLERMIGNEPDKTRLSRQAERCILTLKTIWGIEPHRRQADIHTLLTSGEWRWPLRVYTPEQLAVKEEEMRARLRTALQN